MILTFIANLLRFIALMLLQVLVLDHLDVANGWLVPYLYVLFLLMLPFELPTWSILTIGAFTGLVMDIFSSTPGMHMSACLVMMFARTGLLGWIAPREGYEYGMRPTASRMGLAWFITYAGMLILIHHFWLFYIEVYRFDRFFSTFLRVILSSAFTLGLCLLAQFLTSSQERGRT